MSQEVDAQLLSYLRDIIGAVAALATQMQQHDTEDRLQHAEIRSEMKTTIQRIDALEQRLEDLEGFAKDTGQHELLELSESAKFWPRFFAQAGLALFIAVASVLLTLLFSKGGR